MQEYKTAPSTISLDIDKTNETTKTPNHDVENVSHKSGNSPYNDINH